MTDRPILFSAPMVCALLAGTKTQTRRILKTRKQPSLIDGTWADSYVLDPGNADWLARDVRFAVGDRLWVKETWACHWSTDDQKPSDIQSDLWSVRYFADDHIRPAERDGSLALLDQCQKKRVSIFMPRWASRTTLNVTDVRVERLQDISEADAKAEGLQRRMDWLPQYRGSDSLPWRSEFPRDAYHDLWNSMNGAGAWERNPWVVALTFDVEQRNIDT